MVHTINRKCGNNKCSTSTGIHGGLTFGSGRLDDYGYWSEPCRTCAAHWDSQIPQERKTVRQDLIINGKTEQEAEDYIKDAGWLNYKAWPGENHDG